MIARTSLIFFALSLFSPAMSVAEASPSSTSPTDGMQISALPLPKSKRFESLTIPPDSRNQPSTLQLAIRDFRELLPAGDEVVDWTALKDGASNLLDELSDHEIDDLSKYLQETEYGAMAEDFDRWLTDVVDSGMAKANGYRLSDLGELEHGLRALILGKSLERTDLRRLDFALERLSDRLVDGSSGREKPSLRSQTSRKSSR